MRISDWSSDVCSSDLLGADYAFDLTRPGIALYGGRQREGHEAIAQVVTPEAQVLQRRRVPAGGTVGYNATWRASADTEVAILNIGYAGGYFRGFSNRGVARAGGATPPVLRRVSVELVALGRDRKSDGVGRGADVRV